MLPNVEVLTPAPVPIFIVLVVASVANDTAPPLAVIPANVVVIVLVDPPNDSPVVPPASVIAGPVCEPPVSPVIDVIAERRALLVIVTVLLAGELLVEMPVPPTILIVPEVGVATPLEVVSELKIGSTKVGKAEAPPDVNIWPEDPTAAIDCIAPVDVVPPQRTA